MAEVYEASIAALRQELLNRRGRIERSLGALKNEQSEYAEDHRKLIRVYDALLRTFEAEVTFERELKERAKWQAVSIK